MIKENLQNAYLLSSYELLVEFFFLYVISHCGYSILLKKRSYRTPETTKQPHYCIDIQARTLCRRATITQTTNKRHKTTRNTKTIYRKNGKKIFLNNKAITKLNALLLTFDQQRRSISENIKSCKHWKFETTEDPHFADISVKLHNAVRNNSEYQGSLQTRPNFQIPYANLQISGKC